MTPDQAEIVRLDGELAKARAEIDRMRAVVEAAKSWHAANRHRWFTPGPTEADAADFALVTAVEGL